MQYAILGYQSDEGFAAICCPDPTAHQAFLAYVDAMKAAGVFVFGAGLERPETAKTLRLEGEHHIVQDGPYADTKEQLGALLVIDVPDLDTALEWTSRMPPMSGRICEVRPIPPRGSLFEHASREARHP